MDPDEVEALSDDEISSILAEYKTKIINQRVLTNILTGVGQITEFFGVGQITEFPEIVECL